jgi:predicted Zn finger-like uncharacterized protein
MEVRCERCKTQYELDDSRVSETGVTVQCTTCHHVFVVKKKALVVTVPVKPDQQSPAAPVPLGGTPPAPPPAGIRPLGPPISAAPPVGTASANQGTMEAPPVLPPAAVGPGERGREWRVRQASGNVFTLKDLTTLQKWIVERKVSRDDEISLTGDSWKRLGDIAELATFFQLVDEAQKAAVLQAQVNMGMVPGAPPPAGSARATEPPAPQQAAPPAMAPPQAREPQRGERRSPLLLVLLVLLLAGGASAFYYFQVYLPRVAEAERVATAQRLEQERLVRLEQERLERERLEKERLERERQEQLRAEQAAAEARALADAGSSEDGGVLAGGALGLGDGGAPDAGTPDGGLADAGASPDAGAVVAGGPTVKRPAPVRDFDYYMTQGDRNRERERLEAALDAYAEAAELEPDRAEPYAGRGMAFLDMGDTRQAEAEFKQALKFNPRYGEAIIGLAETYRSQGKKAEAIRHYERYLEILPNGPEASVARSAIERLKE